LAINIVVACDKYKGSLSALDVCNHIKKAINETDDSINVLISPMADGGEGTLDTLVESHSGKYVDIIATSPIGEKINARFGIIGGDTAIIEMAAASGLVLVPEGKRDPMETTTYGTGEMIKKALKMGCKKFIIGLGGSATNDGGMGMAQALGVKFFDGSGKELGLGGKQLSRIEKIDMSGLDPLTEGVLFECACDVENPLTGKNGAAYVYAAQKGADEKMIRELNRGLINFASVIKKDLGKNIRDLSGAGASGGLGGGMVAFLDAKLRVGVNLIMETIGLEEKISGADLVITGEGALDRQTFFGKSAYGVATAAKRYKVAVISINGSVLVERKKLSFDNAGLFSGNFSIINRPMDLYDATDNAGELLESMTREIINFYLKIKSS